MNTQIHQPWNPTCWVGGLLAVNIKNKTDRWISCSDQQLCDLSDDSRYKYAAIKATAAILRAMRE